MIMVKGRVVVGLDSRLTRTTEGKTGYESVNKLHQVSDYYFSFAGFADLGQVNSYKYIATLLKTVPAFDSVKQKLKKNFLPGYTSLLQHYNTLDSNYYKKKFASEYQNFILIIYRKASAICVYTLKFGLKDQGGKLVFRIIEESDINLSTIGKTTFQPGFIMSKKTIRTCPKPNPLTLNRPSVK